MNGFEPPRTRHLFLHHRTTQIHHTFLLENRNRRTATKTKRKLEEKETREQDDLEGSRGIDDLFI